MIAQGKSNRTDQPRTSNKFDITPTEDLNNIPQEINTKALY